MCQLQPPIESVDPMNKEAYPPLDQKQIAEALSFACETTTKAGEIALNYFRRALNIDNKLDDGRFDPVTQADREIESFLREKLGRRYPEFGIIGEEEGVRPGSSNVNWVIDPIDGTKSFISGFPTWGILLGLQQDEKALAGLMYQPVTGELFYGSAAGGVLRQHDKTVGLQTRSTKRLEDAILFCTHESMFVDEASRAAFRRIAAKVRLQRFGGDCYAYCMLALGQIDLVVEDTLQPYDIVPLVPIIEAAGGVITDARGESPVAGGFVVAAASRQLHEAAMSLL
jgi:myo-inositol-1(or 4)-monophosphatase